MGGECFDQFEALKRMHARTLVWWRGCENETVVLRDALDLSRTESGRANAAAEGWKHLYEGEKEKGRTWRWILATVAVTSTTIAILK